ncbi:MAG: hypothetical protein AAF612_06345, partial [Planctomycetota bacterium]
MPPNDPPSRTPDEPSGVSENVGLFGEEAEPPTPPRLSGADLQLVEAYVAQRRSLDDLPYTPELDAITRALADGATPPAPQDVLRRLLNLRKAGKLPALGDSALPATSPAKLDPALERALRELVEDAVGKLSARDRLAAAPEFDRLVERFQATTGLETTPHDLWRVVAKLGKRSASAGETAQVALSSVGPDKTPPAPPAPPAAAAPEVPRPEPLAEADLRVGVVLSARRHPTSRDPAIVLEIDLGPRGVVTSSSQITDLYAPEDLTGRAVVVAAGLGARRVGGIKSHVLTLGVPTPGGIALLSADAGAKPGDP